MFTFFRRRGTRSLFLNKQSKVDQFWKKKIQQKSFAREAFKVVRETTDQKIEQRNIDDPNILHLLDPYTPETSPNFDKHVASIPKEFLVSMDELEPYPDSFAVVQIGAKQYKVTKGDEIMVEKILAPVSSDIILDKVLMVGTKTDTLIGTPVLFNKKVLASVEEQNKAEKVIIFKKKRRKGYQKKNGHRQPYTLLRIVDILKTKNQS
eukprot:TRINITY_DN4032_c0_g1_i1.p1 TRINITY_DN4032_c0_g1~~TRINITY_DN4032_c0_g1_i1.p1  ORF type:complete len:207 (-),score=44.82 TRINITY_DN4032_c0_g1_i1:113-733(-)